MGWVGFTKTKPVLMWSSQSCHDLFEIHVSVSLEALATIGIYFSPCLWEFGSFVHHFPPLLREFPPKILVLNPHPRFPKMLLWEEVVRHDLCKKIGEQNGGSQPFWQWAKLPIMGFFGDVGHEQKTCASIHPTAKWYASISPVSWQKSNFCQWVGTSMSASPRNSCSKIEVSDQGISPGSASPKALSSLPWYWFVSIPSQRDEEGHDFLSSRIYIYI